MTRYTHVVILVAAVGLVASACGSGSNVGSQGAGYGEGADWVSGVAAQAVATAVVLDAGPVPAGDCGKVRTEYRFGWDQLNGRVS